MVDGRRITAERVSRIERILAVAPERQLRAPGLLAPALLALGALALGACASVGPTTVVRDQFDYNGAIAESTRQQLLLNLVRLRYNEAPVFLKVASVISQYTRLATVDAGAGANTGISGDDTASVGGRITWADRPTITYAPLSGQEFSRNLLTPVPMRALFGLIQAGWPADLVIGVTVWSINDLDNDIARPSGRRSADSELVELFGIWQRLGKAGVLGLRGVGLEAGSDDVVMFYRSTFPRDEEQSAARRAEIDADFERFRELLGLDPGVREIQLTYGRVPESGDQVAVLSGSIWDIMLNLAWQFDVPPEHVESGRTGVGFRSEMLEDSVRLDVCFSTDEPEDSYVAVQVQDHWFYIDQNDSRSKRTFSFLELLLNLSETTVPDRSPVISISN
jgi:hypothetical protein